MEYEEYLRREGIKNLVICHKLPEQKYILIYQMKSKLIRHYKKIEKTFIVFFCAEYEYIVKYFT